MAKLYQNKWAGNETYFAQAYPVKTRKSESPLVGGYEIIKIDGEWMCRKAMYYKDTLKDEEHFPCVGEVKINVNRYIRDTMLEALEEANKTMDEFMCGQNIGSIEDGSL